MYVFISGIIAGGDSNGDQLAFNVTLISLLIITPAWIYYGVSGNDSPPPSKQRIFHAIVADLALLIWIYNISIEWTSSFFNIPENATLGAVVLALFTLVVPLLERIFMPGTSAQVISGDLKRATKMEVDNPCDSPPNWPLAPTPTHNPLTIMEWATNTQKDKFGCTRDQNKKFHAGIDINAKVGTLCFATEDATVEEVGYGAAVGKYVSISFKKNNKTYGVAYCHLDKASVKKGDKVKARATLGETGITGNAEPNNPHLHLEIQNQVWVAYDSASDRSKHGVNPNGYVDARV